jgi:hypothetical protein
MTGAELITAERQRQIDVEGWTAQHDDRHTNHELVAAACCYASPPKERPASHHHIIELWPWDILWWKPSPEDRVRELTKAGALIAAEIDRLHRIQGRQENE